MTESIVTASVNSVIAVFVLLLLDVEMLIYSYVNFYYFNGLYTLYFSFWAKQTLNSFYLPFNSVGNLTRIVGRQFTTMGGWWYNTK